MEIIRTILTVIYFIVALAVIILATIQSKDDAGLSSTITGSSTNNFYEKNKGRTKEGYQKAGKKLAFFVCKRERRIAKAIKYIWKNKN